MKINQLPPLHQFSFTVQICPPPPPPPPSELFCKHNCRHLQLWPHTNIFELIILDNQIVDTITSIICFDSVENDINLLSDFGKWCSPSILPIIG